MNRRDKTSRNTRSGRFLLIASLLLGPAACSTPPPAPPSRPKPPPAIEQSFVNADWLKTMLPKSIWPTRAPSEWKTCLPDVAEAGEEQKSEGFRLGYSEYPYLHNRYLKLTRGPQSVVRLLYYKGQASRDSGHLGTLVTFREPLDHDAVKDALQLKLDKAKVYHRMEKGTFVFAGECKVPGAYGLDKRGLAWWRFRGGKLDGLLICAGFSEKSFRLVAFMDEVMNEAVLADLPESLRPMNLAQLKDAERADQQRKHEAWQAYQKKKAAEREAAKQKAETDRREADELEAMIAGAEVEYARLMEAKDYPAAVALAYKAAAADFQIKRLRTGKQRITKRYYEWALKAELADVLVHRSILEGSLKIKPGMTVSSWDKNVKRNDAYAFKTRSYGEMPKAFRKISRFYQALIKEREKVRLAEKKRQERIDALTSPSGPGLPPESAIDAGLKRNRERQKSEAQRRRSREALGLPSKPR